MTEHTDRLQPPVGPRQRAERLIEHTNQVVQQAIEIIAPGEKADPLVVLPDAMERRDDAEPLNLSSEQEVALRGLTAELGFGRKSDQTSQDVGLAEGYVAIIEGGQAHKVEAERQLAEKAGVVIFAGSPHRLITNEAERKSAARILGCELDQVPSNEYQVIRQLALLQSGFELEPGADKATTLRYETHEYGIDDGWSHEATDLVANPDTKFVKLGSRNEQAIYLLRIDREENAQAGEPKYRSLPDNPGMILLAAQEFPDLPIGYHTGGTYQASRSVDVARAGLHSGAEVAVVSYGTERLATVKGEATPAPGPINQLPGELHRAATKIAELEAELEAYQS